MTHVLVDALGNPLTMILTAGQVHDLAGADALLPEMEAKVLLAGKTAVIQPKRIEKSRGHMTRCNMRPGI